MILFLLFIGFTICSISSEAAQGQGGEASTNRYSALKNYCESYNGHLETDRFTDNNCVLPGEKKCDMVDFYYGLCGEEFIQPLGCTEEDEILKPDYPCCEGLDTVRALKLVWVNYVGMEGLHPTCVSYGQSVVFRTYTCIRAYCGDGNCTGEEQFCNCPQDCPSPENKTGEQNKSDINILGNNISNNITLNESAKHKNSTNNSINTSINKTETPVMNDNNTEKEKQNNIFKIITNWFRNLFS